MESTESPESIRLKAELRALTQFLPSKSDRRFGQSLAIYPRELSSSQQYHARELIARARKFQASGPKGTDEDIWSTSGAASAANAASAAPVNLTEYERNLTASNKLEAIRVVRQRTQCDLRTAMEAVEEYLLSRVGMRTADAATSEPRATVELPQGDELEAIVRKVLEPGLASVAQQVERSAQQRQDAFQRTAAREIAQQVAAKVTADVLTEIERRKPREVIVRAEREGVTRTADGRQHKQFERLVRAASQRLPSGYVPGIFLAGEASSGKTTGSHNLAKVLGLSWHFNGAISFPHEMLGFIDAGGKYHRTPFREAYEFGGVYTFDEVDRSDPVALLAVNPHLANGLATFPDGQVERHRDCIIVGTANTWGLGADANYSGATKLDAAFLSRFPVRISWDIDEELESAIVQHAEWLAKVRRAREKARAVGLKVLIDTRAAQAGECLIAAGYTLDEAAAMTYLANLKPEQRMQLQ